MQSGLPRAKKSVFLKGPGELRSQVTVLMESAGSTLLPPLVPAKPSARLVFAHPHLPSEDARADGWERLRMHTFTLSF